MTGLDLRGVRKGFGATPVLDDVSLSVGPREFIAFLGPSGSGKSTLLRIIAGLETADAGEVWLHDQRIDTAPPGKRDVAMVFQHYALYPHMTVAENMAFGLRNQRVAAATIAARIAEAGRMLEITPLLDRKPGQLSGGQRQRVAIGRAIVKQPKLFLLDEPLSNLDAALRGRTRIELAELRQRVDAAMIMVTHDQAEAMTLADRMVVFHDRRIQQIGTPLDVYQHPANTFVARFVGSPAMSLLPATAAAGSVRLGDGTVFATPFPFPDGALTVGLRPEHATVRTGGTGLAAVAAGVERLGDRTLVTGRLGDGAELTGTASGTSSVQLGDTVALTVEWTAAHLFDAAGNRLRTAA